MKLNATYFADGIVAVSKTAQARRSYKGGISRGTGHVPFDTGALQLSIRAKKGEKTAEVVFGGGAVTYAVYLQYGNFAGGFSSRPNRHKGFIERIIVEEYAPYLASKLRAKIIVE